MGEKKQTLPVLLLHGDFHKPSFWGIFSYTVCQGNCLSTATVLLMWTWTSAQPTSWGLHTERDSTVQSYQALRPQPHLILLGL